VRFLLKKFDCHGSEKKGKTWKNVSRRVGSGVGSPIKKGGRGKEREGILGGKKGGKRLHRHMLIIRDKGAVRSGVKGKKERD